MWMKIACSDYLMERRLINTVLFVFVFCFFFIPFLSSLYILFNILRPFYLPFLFFAKFTSLSPSRFRILCPFFLPFLFFLKIDFLSPSLFHILCPLFLFYQIHFLSPYPMLLLSPFSFLSNSLPFLPPFPLHLRPSLFLYPIPAPPI